MHGQSQTDAILDNVFYCESGMDGVNIMNALQDKGGRESMLQENRGKLVIEYQRAKGLKESQDKLLETLPRRKVSFKNHEVPRNDFGVHRVEFKLSKLSENLDEKSLYSLNWKFGKKSSWEQKGITAEHLETLKNEWIEKAESNRWIQPRARFALLPPKSDGDEWLFSIPRTRRKRSRDTTSDGSTSCFKCRLARSNRKSTSSGSAWMPPSRLGI